MTDDLDVLLRALADDLGDPTGWGAPVEFGDSLALCALNSAYSLRATSVSVQRVLARYRAVRPSAETDSGPDLVKAMDDAGGPEAFARDVLRNTTVLPGTSRLRTVGIHEGLSRLAALASPVRTAEQLRAAAKDPAASQAWQSVLGLGQLAWSYLLMNAGVGTETKPDVMVTRYLSRRLGAAHLSREQTHELLTKAAASLGVEPRALDRAIWQYESPSSR
ncbi:hypothetical protein [Luteipulveratus halotolerans]|uniref:Heme peroxidase n=1 Tax=Luteipulveratus halotolerans TaxID=1631356 RepID=A0A0L6CHD4_9MICO|nr:hypothetical protein [Luteipulveratus halotolerans]KNX36980.1 hypothetical protein VV01_07165 [Luteipulveratus halotolerans]